jgi:putative membrane protein
VSAPLPAEAEEWRRLDPRIMLIDPVRAGWRLIWPLVIAAVGIGRSSGPGGLLLAIPLLVVPIVAGVVPWATTRWRIGDGRLVWRRRFIGQRLVTVSLDRVRSVDLQATLFHRALGLAKVDIGTGVDDERITLDSLSETDAQALRTWLLERSRPAVAPAVTEAGADVSAYPVEKPVEVMAELDWSWVRFAPFSLGRLAVVAAAVGVLVQVGDDVGVDLEGVAQGTYDEVVRLGVLLVVALLVVVGTLGWIALACVGYALQWGGLRVTREGGAVHVRAGVLTTRSTTVEEARVRGVELVEPVLMRLVTGAELNALSTGVGKGGTTKVLPPCPRAVAEQVADRLLGVGGSFDERLLPHGPAARRRRHVRGLVGGGAVAAVLVVLAAAGVLGWWVVVPAALALAAGAALAESSYRHLGHRLTPDHLVAGGGVLARRRTVLERDGVIGWVVTQTWFQRRVGLATLTAATAAGSEAVAVVDVPLADAVALAGEASPELVRPFAEPLPAAG